MLWIGVYIIAHFLDGSNTIKSSSTKIVDFITMFISVIITAAGNIELLK
jgi:hypothetical protein